MSENPLEKIFHFFSKEHDPNKKEEVEQDISEKINDIYESLNSEVIMLCVGNDCAQFGEEILKQITESRLEYADEMGFVMPIVRVQEFDELQENQIIVKIRGMQVEERYVIPTKDEVLKEIKSIIDNIIENYIDKIFTYESMEHYLNLVQKENSWLVWNLTCIASMQDIKCILINILKEHKSIKEISYIFEQIYENIADYRKNNSYCSNINIELISKNIVSQL